MKTIFESPNGKVVRNAVGHTVETRGGEQLLIRDMATELERLQEVNAKLRAALEAAMYHGGSTRDEWMPAFVHKQMRDALAETAQ